MDNPELFDRVINKLASVLPEKLSQNKLKEIIADRVPKAFYYEALLETLLNPDSRSPEIILTEARVFAKLITRTVEKDFKLPVPQTTI
jgi:hypothetical protein